MRGENERWPRCLWWLAFWISDPCSSAGFGFLGCFFTHSPRRPDLNGGFSVPRSAKKAAFFLSSVLYCCCMLRAGRYWHEGKMAGFFFFFWFSVNCAELSRSCSVFCHRLLATRDKRYELWDVRWWIFTFDRACRRRGVTFLWCSVFADASWNVCNKQLTVG